MNIRNRLQFLNNKKAASVATVGFFCLHKLGTTVTQRANAGVGGFYVPIPMCL